MGLLVPSSVTSCCRSGQLKKYVTSRDIVSVILCRPRGKCGVKHGKHVAWKESTSAGGPHTCVAVEVSVPKGCSLQVRALFSLLKFVTPLLKGARLPRIPINVFTFALSRASHCEAVSDNGSRVVRLVMS